MAGSACPGTGANNRVPGADSASEPLAPALGVPGRFYLALSLPKPVSMEIFFSLPQKRLFYLAYWVGYVLLFSLVQGLPARDFLTALINELLSLPPKLLFVHLVVELLMGWAWGKWRVFVPLYGTLILVAALLQRLVDNFLILPYFLPDWRPEPLLSVPPFLYSIVKLQFVVAVPACVWLLQYVARERSAAQTARAEKLLAELAVLRQQFHPHFLFNVLNGLYSKVLEGSEEAPGMLLRLSEMMRYHVYEAGDRPVRLAREVHYLQSYISLQQKRFGSRLSLVADFSGPLDEVWIEPLLLLPFIENSFKHALRASPGAEGWITIYLSVADQWLSLRVENSRPEPGGTIDDESPGGFGLSNVQRRLHLLYPERHLLELVPEPDRFFVLLKIHLHAV
ncbi:MAG: hypothetical protein EOP50_00545 [Sphingobacteriales bacterium]|nr:MAG: hypothetical protein EOP50_00545 [Sphingobacteriales bacterium]